MRSNHVDHKVDYVEMFQSEGVTWTWWRSTIREGHAVKSARLVDIADAFD